MNTADDLREKVDAIPFWYHRIELPHGIVTSGWAPIDPLAYKIPETPDGKHVLNFAKIKYISLIDV
jgi:tRNA (mo5U34)-methyltransferase